MRSVQKGASRSPVFDTFFMLKKQVVKNLIVIK